jgi:hypothetical protein
MTFHEELLQSCPPPFGRMFGKKEDGYDAHLSQEKLLPDLMLTMLRRLQGERNGVSLLNGGERPTRARVADGITVAFTVCRRRS